MLENNIMKILKKSNGKYVLVEGIFNSKKKGHFDRLFRDN